MKTKKRIKSTYKGLPLVDADGDLDITVTKADTANARKNDPNKCAAALSIKRELKTEAEVHISRTYIKDNEHNRYIRFITPNSISREITSFDRSAIFEPGNYTLKAPSSRVRLGTYRGKSYEKHSGKKRTIHTTMNVRRSAKEDYYAKS